MNTSSGGIDGRLIFRVGIALVMVGMLLLFRYSIELFGPVARLGMGATTSALLVVAGTLVPRRGYGRLMQGAGVAGGYITAWAAHDRYDLVDPTIAFIQLVMVAALGVGLAWRERSDILNALGLVGAVAAPLLVGGDFVVADGEVAYQSAVLLLAGFLYVRYGWFVGLALTVIGSGVVLFAMLENPSGTLLAGVAVWWLMGWALPVLGRWAGVTPVASDLLTLATIPVPVAAWSMVWAVDGRPSVVALVAALGAIIHFAVWLADRDESESVIQLLAGVGFSALALLSWFEAEVAVPLYLLVTSAVAVYGSRIGDRTTAVIATLMGALALPVWLFLVGVGGRFSWPEAIGDLASVLIVAVAAFLLTGPIQKGTALTAYGMALAWIAGHLGDLDPGLVTAGFAVVGLVSLVTGRIREGRLLIIVGLATLALAVVKLVLVDLASADSLLKVALSLGIGMALLMVGYWVGDTALLGDREEATDPATEAATGETLDH